MLYPFAAGQLYVTICLLLFYVLATSKVILGWLRTCDSAHSWRIYSATSLEHQATSTMTWLLSHSVTLSWHWANQSFPYRNNAEHQARKRQGSILKSSVWLYQGSNPRGSDSNPILWDGIIVFMWWYYGATTVNILTNGDGLTRLVLEWCCSVNGDAVFALIQ